jgi:hypothetical protein
MSSRLAREMIIGLEISLNMNDRASAHWEDVSWLNCNE